MLFIGSCIEMSPVVMPTVLNYGFKVFLVLIHSMSDGFHYSLASIQLITRNSLFSFFIFWGKKFPYPFLDGTFWFSLVDLTINLVRYVKIALEKERVVS